MTNMSYIIWGCAVVVCRLAARKGHPATVWESAAGCGWLCDPGDHTIRARIRQPAVWLTSLLTLTYHITYNNISLIITHQLWNHVSYDAISVMMTCQLWCHITYNNISVMITCQLWCHISYDDMSVIDKITGMPMSLSTCSWWWYALQPALAKPRCCSSVMQDTPSRRRCTRSSSLLWCHD